MLTVHIKPVDVHERLWSLIDSSSYGHTIKFNKPEEKEQVTIQAFHTAIEHIFLSVEELPNAQLDNHLESFVDQAALHNALCLNGLVDPPEIVKCKVHVGQETFFGHDTSDVRLVERIVYESTRTLVDLAFSPAFEEFTESIEQTIATACAQSAKPFNRYAVVDVTPIIGKRGRIISLEVKLGEDIRFQFFRKCFPNGRYRAPDDGEVYTIPGL